LAEKKKCITHMTFHYDIFDDMTHWVSYYSGVGSALEFYIYV
jgi:hypothetical protein